MADTSRPLYCGTCLSFTTDSPPCILTATAGAGWELPQGNYFEEPLYATPAIADRRLNIRTASALPAIGAPGGW